ncbi:MAG: hypothetical protein IT435_10095 [Phycisphaerales bacterium]|nr:hypothetical protein [Phycisphaerales bacterium]
MNRKIFSTCALAGLLPFSLLACEDRNGTSSSAPPNPAPKADNTANVLLAVHVENGDETDRAKKIFEELGAEDIHAAAEATAEVKVPSNAARRTTV